MSRSAALAVLMLLAPLVQPAHACDCVRPKPLSEAVRTEAALIFEGRVVEIVDRSLLTSRTTSGGGSGEAKSLGHEIVFEVTRTWAGTPRKRASVYAEDSDCMFSFEIDRSYVVFANRDAKARLTTSICTRTTAVEQANDIIRALGPPKVAVAAPQATPTPATFKTRAEVSVDRTVLSLSSAVATIEPRPNAPGYRWLRVHFYAFPLTAADVAGVVKGNVDSLERRWKSQAGNRAAYNLSNAVLQFGVDKDGKVWQIDLSVPGHACAVAASDREATSVIQDYRFDGARLRLKSRGSHTCDMNTPGVPNPKFTWDVDLDVPVFATSVR